VRALPSLPPAHQRRWWWPATTASALALPSLAAELPVPSLGVLQPGAARACRLSESGRIGVIGTEATIRSDAYAEAIRALRPGAEIFSVPSPLFVPLAEEGMDRRRGGAPRGAALSLGLRCEPDRHAGARMPRTIRFSRESHLRGAGRRHPARRLGRRRRRRRPDACWRRTACWPGRPASSSIISMSPIPRSASPR
jgi:hypothetical protein